MEENALSEMSFKGGALQLPTECKPDSALEHRRWLEFGLGTDAKRFAPIRQGEGDSRIMKEFPKNHGFFGVSFSAIFLHEKKDGIPEGRSPLRSGLFHREQSPGLFI